MRSFEMVTGPKTDRWLVRTIGLLLAVIGAALITGAAQKTLTPEMAILGAGTACALLGIDVFYVSKKRISRVYLLDALAELILLMAWIMLYIF